MYSLIFSSMASFFDLVPELIITVKVKSLSHVWLFATPWTIASQAPPFMGFPRQEYWSGLPFPSPEESSQPRDQTQVSCIAGRFFMVWATGESHPLWDMLQSNRCFWQNLQEGAKQGNMAKKYSKEACSLTQKICCCCCLVAKSHLTLCDLMDYSTPGSSVLHCLPDFAKIHVQQIYICVYIYVAYICIHIIPIMCACMKTYI